MAEENNLDQILNDGNNKFTGNFFFEVAKSQTNKSIVLSAFSMLPPLAQLALASSGESHDELLNVMGMPNDNITKATFSYVNTKLRSIKGITLNMANKIYVAKNYTLKDTFAATSWEIFDSEIQKIDFLQQHKAAEEINAWVEDKTNHRIKNLIQPSTLTSDTRALLVNAIYFKGTWQTPFDENDTTNKKFYVTKNKVIRVPTMYKRGYYKYTENKKLNAQILEISYEGDESSFVIVLPRKKDGINKLLKILKDTTVLDKAITDLEVTKVDVYIPKFKIETTTNLKDVLKKMNVNRVFSPKLAKLDNLLKDASDFYIEEAVQKAFIEINEAGTEAAAANAMYTATTSLNRVKSLPPQFKANRPFYFAVKTNALTLFNGVIMDVFTLGPEGPWPEAADSEGWLKPHLCAIF